MQDKPLCQPTMYRLTDPLSGDTRLYCASLFVGREPCKAVRARRNIGERVDGISTPASRKSHVRLTELAGKTDAKLGRNLDRIIHGAAFAAWIAVRSGRLHIDQVLGDCGILHELIHRYRFGCPWANGSDDSGCTHERIVGLLRMLEAATPEMWHPDTDHGSEPTGPYPLVKETDQ